jgi:hypothetical protein
MEDQIAEIERRMDEWEVKRKRSQRGAVLWFGMLTVAVIGSLMLMLTHQGQAVPAHQPASYAQHASPTRN